MEKGEIFRGESPFKKLIIELTEYLLKRDYFKLEETELIFIINVNLLSSSIVCLPQHLISRDGDTIGTCVFPFTSLIVQWISTLAHV